MWRACHARKRSTTDPLLDLQRLVRVTDAIEHGDAVPPIVDALRRRQAEREELIAGIAAADTAQQLRIDRADVTRRVLAQMHISRQLLTSNGRQVFRELLEEPIRFTPENKQYRFEGRLRVGSYIAGVAGLSPLGGVPNPPRHSRSRCGASSESLSAAAFAYFGFQAVENGVQRSIRRNRFELLSPSVFL